MAYETEQMSRPLSQNSGAVNNLTTLNIKQFLDQIEENLELGAFLKPLLSLGPSGIGKTESVRGLAKELDEKFREGRGAEYFRDWDDYGTVSHKFSKDGRTPVKCPEATEFGIKEVRLVNMTEVDVRGMPILQNVRTTNDEGVDVETRMASFAPSDVFPHPKYWGGTDPDYGILLLDEITSCDPALRAAILQLLDSSRAIGKYKFPPTWMIVALGNGEQDGGIFNGMEMATFSRCICCRTVTSVPVWLEWATQAKLHPAVLAYFDANPQEEHLYAFDPDEITTRLYQAPRSWAALSDMIAIREKKGRDVLAAVSLQAGCYIGQEEASKFVAFFKMRDALIPVRAVIEKGQMPTAEQLENAKVNQIGALYIAGREMAGLIHELTDEYVQKQKDKAKGLITKEEYVKHVEDFKIKLGHAFKLLTLIHRSGTHDAALAGFKMMIDKRGAALSSILIEDEKFNKDYPELMEMAQKVNHNHGDEITTGESEIIEEEVPAETTKTKKGSK